MLRLNHFPTQWKCAEIATVAKPNKLENVAWPTSLLTTYLRKNIYEDQPQFYSRGIISYNQFGFKNEDGSIEQGLRVGSCIREAIESKEKERRWNLTRCDTLRT